MSLLEQNASRQTRINKKVIELEFEICNIKEYKIKAI